MLSKEAKLSGYAYSYFAPLWSSVLSFTTSRQAGLSLAAENFELALPEYAAASSPGTDKNVLHLNELDAQFVNSRHVRFNASIDECLKRSTHNSCTVSVTEQC